MTTAAIDQRSVFELATGVTGPSNDRVDEAAGVIRGVKILGLDSNNRGYTLGLTAEEFGDAVNRPYSYTMEALRQAVPLYEGATVYSNHARFEIDKKTGRRLVEPTQRDNDDLVGWFENVKVIEGQGLFGDFHYVKAHPMSARVIEIARRRPDKLAFSHEAYFDDPRVIDGKIYLTKIVRVDCVALVSDKPGTTHGMFESTAPERKPPMSKTIKQILESVDKSTPGHKRLLEMMNDQQLGAEVGAVAVDAPPDAKPEDQIKAGILAAIVAKLEKASPAEIEAVLAALGMGDSLSEAAAGKPGSGGGGGGEGEGKPAGETAIVDRSGVVLECIGMLRECGVSDYHEAVLEAMAALPTKEKRLAFARSQKPAGGQIKPRSQAPEPGKVVAETTVKPDGIDYSKDLERGAMALRGVI